MGRPGVTVQFWIPAAIAFLLAGILELMFCALSVLGTILGGFASVAALGGVLRNEEAFMGPLLLVFYGIWACATAIAGPLHVVAGAFILMGRRNRKLMWAATVASILPMATVYCAPTSALAGVLGLLALIFTMPRPEEPKV